MADYTSNMNLKMPTDEECFDIEDFNQNSRIIDTEMKKRLVKNEDITPKTKAKITYDEKGLVIGGEDLTPDDIPNIHISKIEGRPPIVYIDGVPIYGSRFFDVDKNGNAILREDGSGDYLLTVLENGEIVLRDVITQVTDNLESTSSEDALSANQGRILSGFIGKTGNLLTVIKTSLVEAINEVFESLSTHIRDTDNPHSVTKAQVGLGNVDNTADANKNVLSATKLTVARKINGVSFDGSEDITIEDSTKIPTSQKGAAGGVAELDENGLISSSQLPSYVDDVIEGTLSAFPATGESGKIYVDTQTELAYRWSGSMYVEISKSLALGETSYTAYAGNKGKQNADDIASLKERMSSAETDISSLEDDVKSTEAALKEYTDSKTQNVYIDGMLLCAVTFVDVLENGDVYLREDGSGDYLLYVPIDGIPRIRYMGNAVTDNVTGVSYSLAISNGTAVLKEII